MEVYGFFVLFAVPVFLLVLCFVAISHAATTPKREG